MGHHHQVVEFFVATTLTSHWGRKHTNALLLLHALRVAISKGFLLFTMPTLFFFRFQVISHVNIVFTPYTVQLGSLSKTHPHFILNPLLHYFLINEPRR